MHKETVFQLLWKTIKAIFLLPSWWLQKNKNRDPNIWIFGAWYGTRYADNSRAFFEYVLANCPEIKPYWVTKSKEVYQMLKAKSLPVVYADSKEGRIIQKRASIFFLTVGFEDANPAYLKGCKIIWLGHGMPLKLVGKAGHDFLTERTLWKKTKTFIRKIILPYEFIVPYKDFSVKMISTSSFFTKFIMPSFNICQEDMWEVGQPRNDKLFLTEEEPFITNIRQQFNNPQIVLYMPTFRDAELKKDGVFDPFTLAGFDLPSFDRILKDNNIVFLYKGHFFDTNNSFLSDDSRILTVSDKDYGDLYSFLKDIDVLVTDYSSVYFDFLLCQKPIVLFPFDIESYNSASRPFYYDYELLQAKRVHSWQEMGETLKNKDYYVPSDETIKLFNTYTDGNSCKRIYEKIVQTMS